MGMLYRFVCAACGYTAEVSGGEDAGMRSGTTTIACEQCRKLYDVVIEKKTSDGTEFKQCAPRCPKSARHPFRIWTNGDPCPRCGGIMENQGMTILWD